jgi:hypothetical protein
VKIFLLVLSGGLVALTASYFWDEKKSELYPKEFILGWGERMKNTPNGGQGKNCYPTNFSTSEYPELKEELLEAKRLNMFHPDQSGNGLLNIPLKNCFSEAKLVELKVDNSMNMAWAVYRCEKDGMGLEVKLSSYDVYCSYTHYLTKWNFPIGKYTPISMP